MNICIAWRTVKESTIVNCWRKADILIINNYYIVELNNLELDNEHKEEIQRVKTDNVKMLENKHNKL